MSRGRDQTSPVHDFKAQDSTQRGNTRWNYRSCSEKGLDGDWLEVVWGRRSGALRNKRNMLILDAFRGHLTLAVKKQPHAMNGDLVIIPGGMTSQLQVLDVVVICYLQSISVISF